MIRTTRTTTVTLKRTLAILAALALSVACSSEPDGPDRPIDVVDDAGSDADSGDLDSGQPDADAADPGDVEGDAGDSDEDASTPDADAEERDAADADADETDAADADVDEPDATDADADEPDVEEPPTACEEATIDLGVLENGSNPVEIAATHPAVVGAGVCDGAFGAEHVVVAFELPEDGVLTVDAPGSAVTLSATPCSTSGAFCFSDVSSLNVVAGAQFYLAFERLASDLNADIVFEPLVACTPVGERTCVNTSEIEACTTGLASAQTPTRVTLDCPAGCESDSCLGDSCQNPIVVEGSVSVEARSETLSNTFDNQGAPGCIWDTPSEGRELVFQVDDVAAGETIVVTINDPIRYYRVSILQSCSESAECLESTTPGSVLEYEATETGTYFVIIDAETDLPSGPEISIDIEAASDL
ncbi:hypothetical protein FRC96_03535 [Lujinxingia vulgaris]|uniref:Peptidase C-terminal archaeal/bacterial domain-containing protein n=1 Tax=Lujinxingia vulgaris TaxID=2600176 RepID=A0A5C6XJX3_9DELT|nr:hypothetical protein [Lujinxingia vulgaris]TXD41781.1 hypothetical protein FRC96_03535 [Lujinxingia vulgaris]